MCVTFNEFLGVNGLRNEWFFLRNDIKVPNLCIEFWEMCLLKMLCYICYICYNAVGNENARVAYPLRIRSEKSASFWGNLHFWVCGLLFYSCALGVEEFISTLDEELAVEDEFVICSL